MTERMRIAWVAACVSVVTVAEKPWTVLNLDADYYEYAFPCEAMTAEAIDRHIAGYLKGPVTHLFICANSQRASYDSKVLEKRYEVDLEPENECNAEVKHMARNMRRLIDEGVDPVGAKLDAARRHGAEGWVSMRMNDGHHMDNPKSAVHSRFWRGHPEFWCTPYDRSGKTNRRCFDYSHAEIRALAVRVIAELLERYDCDGIDLDWMRYPAHLRNGQEREFSNCLTEVVREARKLADAAAGRRAHRVGVCVTVPAALRTCEALGIDAAGWAKGGLVDVVMPANYYHTFDNAFDFREWRTALGPRMKIVPRFDQQVSHDGGCALATIEEFRGWFDIVLAQGCRDFAFFNLFDLDTRKSHPGLWQLAVEEGITPKRVRSAKRAYPLTFDDAYAPYITERKNRPFDDIDKSLTRWPFPLPADGRHSVEIFTGSAEGVKRVYLEMGFTNKVLEAPAVTLNGVKPGAAREVGNRYWFKWFPKCGFRYEFPASAFRAGKNTVGVPEVKGNAAYVCEIFTEP